MTEDTRIPDDYQPPAADLADAVADLQPGDKIRATYHTMTAGTFVIEGEVHTSGLATDRLGDSELAVGPRGVRWRSGVPDTLVSVEVLERAVPAFYTNHPADRKPRIGDVWTDDGTHMDYDRAIFNGYVWLQTKPTNERLHAVHVCDIRPGSGRLVDPSELEGSA
jgi:hypothetical protein